MHFLERTRRERLVYELCAFLDNCQSVSNTWKLHPFKYLYLDNYNILEE